MTNIRAGQPLVELALCFSGAGIDLPYAPRDDLTVDQKETFLRTAKIVSAKPSKKDDGDRSRHSERWGGKITHEPTFR